MTERRAPVRGTTPLLQPPREPTWSSLHPPLPGCEPVPLHDFAYSKYTRQSSVVSDPYSGWMFATEPEVEPWWEIDLGAAIHVERVGIWLDPIAAGAEVTVVAHGLPTRKGEPAPASFRFTALVDDLPRATDGSAVLWIAADTVARHVRVSLRRPTGEEVALLVRGAEILAARLFLESLPESYARAFTLFADRPLFAARPAPGEGPFEITHRYRDVWTAARSLAHGLATLVEPAAAPADRVFLGLCTRNRPEWLMGDIAAALRGYVVVGLSPDDPDDRLADILERCPLSAVIVDGHHTADRFLRLAARCPSLRLVVTCDAPSDAASPSSAPAPTPSTTPPLVLGFDDLLVRGAAADPLLLPAAPPRDGRDLHTVLFTSGSSGTPKGAMRSRATFLAMLESYGVPQPAVHLSFQPLGHISERMYLPALVLQGALIGFSAGGPHVLSDLKALEPSAVGSVPRLFEVVFAAHRRKLAAALAAAPDAPRDDVEARVLAESRQVFGSRVQGIGVGSAPCSAELLAFLQRCFADLWVADGYGSTELGTITTAGHVHPNVEVKLVPVEGLGHEAGKRGEIWVRTPHVIDGYLGDPESTAQSLDADGFFRTGDLGERTPEGVRVVGRVRNVIKLGQGEFVAVDRVEAVLATSPLVDRIFVHPDASNSALLAVVVPSFGALAALLGVPEGDPHDLAARPEAARAIARALAGHGRRAGLASFEIPRAVLVEPEPMTVASGLLTPSGKLARPAAVARYGPRLAALGSALAETASDGDSLAAQLRAVVSDVVGRRVELDEPIHDHGLGVDSLMAAEVLHACASVIGREVPLAVWFEARTLADLAGRLEVGLLGSRAPVDDLPRQDLDIDLSPGIATSPSPARVPFEAVLLTGATGLLGAHLLESLVLHGDAGVVCLVRAPSDEAARERVRETLARYEIPPLDESRWRAVAGDLAAPRLGLDPARHAALADEVDAILHAGAEVNWLAPYAALRAANVLGTAELCRLAATTRLKPLHFVSTISTAPGDGDESSILSFEQARASGGYGTSKWVAEQLVRRAGERGHPIAVYRPAMITGHGVRGLGNPDDYVHRYLRACVTAGVYLDAPAERLDMTPVDFVSRGIVALMAAHPEGGGTWHLSNLHQSMTYTELGKAVESAGYPCAPRGHAGFRSAAVLPPGSPLRPLGAYFPEAGFALHMGPWPCQRSRDQLAALGVVSPPVSEQLVAAALAGLARRGLLACPGLERHV